MQLITLETQIAAPPERCFLLSLSVDLHQVSASSTEERAIDGVTQGLMGPGDTVTWRGRHFGIWLTQKTRITGYFKPDWFRDAMEEGVFRTFVHDHCFEQIGGGTLMRDTLRFVAPLGPLGWAAEVMFLRRHMIEFLLKRNAMIKELAESPDEGWRVFLH